MRAIVYISGGRVWLVEGAPVQLYLFDLLHHGQDSLHARKSFTAATGLGRWLASAGWGGGTGLVRTLPVIVAMGEESPCART